MSTSLGDGAGAFDWVQILSVLSCEFSEFLVWKHLDRGVTGLGDVDAAAPRRLGPAVTEALFRTARAQMSRGDWMATCDHIPNTRLHFFMVERSWPRLLQFDVVYTPTRYGAPWSLPADLLTHSYIDGSGVRSLKPGAEALVLLILLVLPQGPPSRRASDWEFVKETIEHDTEGVLAAVDSLVPPPARRPVRSLVESVSSGGWPSGAGWVAAAGFAAAGLKEPRLASERARFKLLVRRDGLCQAAHLGMTWGRTSPYSDAPLLRKKLEQAGHEFREVTGVR